MAMSQCRILAISLCLARHCLWAAVEPAELLKESGVKGGLVVHANCGDGKLTAAFRVNDGFIVHGLDADAKNVETARKQIQALGLYGPVSVQQFTGDRLPYADNLVNLFVAEQLGSLSLDEVLRVLVPNGVALIGGRKTVKPRPTDIDEWTHYLHGADGNPVAKDRVVGPPKHYQWIADPLWARCHETDSSVSTLVTAGGRIFAIVDEAPPSLVGQHSLPDKWSLVARDAFNGVLLWKVPIPHWGWREWKNTWFNSRPGDIPLNIQKRLVAAGDKVYITLGYQAPVSQLDAVTGKILQTYQGTERANEILYSDGRLFLSVLAEGGARVMAIDPAGGGTLWTSRKMFKGTTTDYIKWVITPVSPTVPKLDPALNMATDGSVVALIDGAEIVSLDAHTGAEKWRTAFPAAEEDRKAGGNAGSSGELWVGTMIVSDGVVLHASPGKLAAFSGDTGKLLWNQPKKYIGHLWYEWKDVFVIDTLVWTWSGELGVEALDGGKKGKERALYPSAVLGYDIKTGELKKKVPTGPIFKANHHHRCYRNKATSRYILASRRGTEFVDLEQGKHTLHNWVRGTCHVGMMPANGLQYAPPHPCACYLDEKLNGFFALAPEKQGTASRERKGESGKPDSRLERGPAFAEISNLKLQISKSDWPVFRHDSARTGSAETQVPDDSTQLWSVKAGGSLTPPIVAGDRVFAAVPDEHQVVCLAVQDGRLLWNFTTGGRIDSPPAWHNGTVLFGSADGWVYCLRAADGVLAWRFRAAPEARLIGAFGQLESAWPVHGSVLVHDGQVYFSAGRSSQLDGGIHIFALDAATGELRHQTRLEGPDYYANEAGKLGVLPRPESGPTEYEANNKLPMGALTDVMMCDGSRIFMRSLAFDMNLKQQSGQPDILPGRGYLDGSFFKRTPWRIKGAGTYANLGVCDQRSIYFVRMFDSIQALDPMVYFTPGAKGYLLVGKTANAKNDTWSLRVPVRVLAMAQASGRLFVAGPPDVVDPADPLGAFENRLGGLLYVIDSASGSKIAERKLAAPPVFNGIAIAGKKLFLSTTDGRITCIGCN